MQVSIGQAGANALAAFLRTQFASDVTVFDRWPEANVNLFAPNASGLVPRAVVSVVKVGRRRRLDVSALWSTSQVLTNNSAIVNFDLGSIEQPLQMDVWTKSDDDRDDIIAQLDVILNAGLPTTANLPGDPLRDGILIPSVLADNWPGIFFDCWFDEPQIDDTPDSVQRAEYRATYFGQARSLMQQTQTVAPMTSLTLKNYSSESASQAPTAETATLKPNPSPPPAGKVTYGTSS